MKKKRVTYGVLGMMEFQAIIKIGRSTMKVLFTDGSMNAMGATPATYTTDSLMVQHAIESSDQFQRGRIHIVRSILLDEEVRIERNSKAEKAPAFVHEASEQTEAPEDGKNGACGDGNEPQEAVGCSAEAEDVSAPVLECAELTEMEFDNNDDARDFLEAKFGYVRSKLRLRADIVAAGKAHGIDIIFV